MCFWLSLTELIADIKNKKPSRLKQIFVTLQSKIKIMETKLKIVSILVNYQSSKEPNQEFWTKRQFNTSLRSQSLSSINSIFISYKLNEVYNLNLKIEHGSSQYKWDVYNGNEFFFSFISKDEKNFINLFDQRLNLELEKQHKRLAELSLSPNYMRNLLRKY